ncbi:MAG: hypothetical protein AABX75_00630 [Nanoarchaeota archaeon]
MAEQVPPGFPTQGFGFNRPKPEAPFRPEIYDNVASLSSRVRLVEERVDMLRGHIEMLDNSLIEKHKSVISELRGVENDIRTLRGDVEQTKSVVDRMAKRMEELAGKEELKVLERYVSMWQPMSFVTRSEVASTVKSILSDAGIKVKAEKTNE